LEIAYHHYFSLNFFDQRLHTRCFRAYYTYCIDNLQANSGKILFGPFESWMIHSMPESFATPTRHFFALNSFCKNLNGRGFGAVVRTRGFRYILYHISNRVYAVIYIDAQFCFYSTALSVINNYVSIGVGASRVNVFKFRVGATFSRTHCDPTRSQTPHTNSPADGHFEYYSGGRGQCRLVMFELRDHPSSSAAADWPQAAPRPAA
jgi:hypothetical protein